MESGSAYLPPVVTHGAYTPVVSQREATRDIKETYMYLIRFVRVTLTRLRIIISRMDVISTRETSTMGEWRKIPIFLAQRRNFFPSTVYFTETFCKVLGYPTSFHARAATSSH